MSLTDYLHQQLPVIVDECQDLGEQPPTPEAIAACETLFRELEALTDAPLRRPRISGDDGGGLWLEWSRYPRSVMLSIGAQVYHLARTDGHTVRFVTHHTTAPVLLEALRWLEEER